MKDSQEFYFAWFNTLGCLIDMGHLHIFWIASNPSFLYFWFIPWTPIVNLLPYFTKESILTLSRDIR